MEVISGGDKAQHSSESHQNLRLFSHQSGQQATFTVSF